MSRRLGNSSNASRFTESKQSQRRIAQGIQFAFKTKFILIKAERKASSASQVEQIYRLWSVEQRIRKTIKTCLELNNNAFEISE